eukprot:m.115655 g.115655  ORF g.115655 m.115655 type:complete len:80 (-) comp9293_c3_seq8:2632-2871(-)
MTSHNVLACVLTPITSSRIDAMLPHLYIYLWITLSIFIIFILLCSLATYVLPPTLTHFTLCDVVSTKPITIRKRYFIYL